MGAKSGDRQYAALPYRTSKKRGLEVMLVTSRETRRWIIPKGWPIAGVEPHDLAALEAMEEAGLLGKVCDKPIGTYHYDKKRGDGSIVNCTVDTFPLEVEEQMPIWPEQKQRKTQWFAPEEAAMQVQEPELRELIRNLADNLAKKLHKKLR
ncbi:MAG TPA: NUDIX hydrolase [Xanthobacteraceae bacterium]|nr:NUDIX hydrolase [Xanthobacteraceae bacterium]